MSKQLIKEVNSPFICLGWQKPRTTEACEGPHAPSGKVMTFQRNSRLAASVGHTNWTCSRSVK